MYRKNKKWYIIGGVIILLIAFRLYLPTLVLNYVNNTLNEIPDYRGHVDDIDIAIIRGAYEIKGIELNKLSGKVPVPFFAAEELDLSVEWKSLFKGAVVGEIMVERPQLNFVQGPTEAQSQTSVDSSWIDVVKDLMPLNINRLQINNGEIHYRDFHSSPKVDILMTNFNATALNLRNTEDKSELLPSTVDVTSDVYGGKFTVHMDIDPLQENPTFDLNSELTNVDMAQLNAFLKAYGKFDVRRGKFGLYTEVAAKDGRFEGYVKPTMEDLDVVQFKKEEGSFLAMTWESIVGLATEALENQSQDRVATKIPLSGSFEKPEVDILATIGGILKNAFIKALVPSVEGSVSIQDVRKEDTGNKGGGSKKEERKQKREEKKEKEKK